VTEAATNLVKHAQQGQLLVRALEHGSIAGLELLALDSGPAFKTCRSLCTMLLHRWQPRHGPRGADPDRRSIRHLFSARHGHRAAAGDVERQGSADAEVENRAVCQPKSGEEVFGRRLGSCNASAQIHAYVGRRPRPRARCAQGGARRHRHTVPISNVSPAHPAGKTFTPPRGHAWRGSRGLRARPGTAVCRFAGWGNIGCTVIVDTVARHMVSPTARSGTRAKDSGVRGALAAKRDTGHAFRRRVYAVGSGSLPWLSARHPSLIAAVLYRDFSRHRDDATVVVATQRRAKS
jgi:hypothetical protein